MKPCCDSSTATFGSAKRTKLSFLGFLSTALFSLSCISAQGALIGNYKFDGNFSNSEGSLPSMTSIVAPAGTSGFLPEGGWYWANYNNASGLNVETPELENYSFAITFQFSNTNGYRKVVDFSGLTLDEGLYIYDGIFRFFGYPDNGEASIAPNTPITILATRSSAGVVNLYAKGESGPIMTFDDSSAEYFTLNGSLNFFLDDRGNGEYSPAGSVSQIMIWNTALSSQEVDAVFQAIPEPMTLNLLGVTALAAIAFRHLSRRRSS